jgi:hypothetical protein
LEELKVIQNKYWLWEKKNWNKNDYIVEWNVKARKKYKRKIRSKRIAMKQGVLHDF